MTRPNSGWWRVPIHLVHCHMTKIPKMEEILKTIVTVQKTILIGLHLSYLRLPASELMKDSSSKTDSFLMGVWSFLIRKIVLREKVRKEGEQCSLWIPGMWARLVLRSGGHIGQILEGKQEHYGAEEECREPDLVNSWLCFCLVKLTKAGAPDQDTKTSGCISMHFNMPWLH